MSPFKSDKNPIKYPINVIYYLRDDELITKKPAGADVLAKRPLLTFLVDKSFHQVAWVTTKRYLPRECLPSRTGAAAAEVGEKGCK